MDDPRAMLSPSSPTGPQSLHDVIRREMAVNNAGNARKKLVMMSGLRDVFERVSMRDHAEDAEVAAVAEAERLKTEAKQRRKAKRQALREERARELVEEARHQRDGRFGFHHGNRDLGAVSVVASASAQRRRRSTYGANAFGTDDTRRRQSVSAAVEGAATTLLLPPVPGATPIDGAGPQQQQQRKRSSIDPTSLPPILAHAAAKLAEAEAKPGNADDNDDELDAMAEARALALEVVETAGHFTLPSDGSLPEEFKIKRRPSRNTTESPAPDGFRAAFTDEERISLNSTPETPSSPTTSLGETSSDGDVDQGGLPQPHGSSATDTVITDRLAAPAPADAAAAGSQSADEADPPTRFVDPAAATPMKIRRRPGDNTATTPLDPTALQQQPGGAGGAAAATGAKRSPLPGRSPTRHELQSATAAAAAAAEAERDERNFEVFLMCARHGDASWVDLFLDGDDADEYKRQFTLNSSGKGTAEAVLEQVMGTSAAAGAQAAAANTSDHRRNHGRKVRVVASNEANDVESVGDASDAAEDSSDDGAADNTLTGANALIEEMMNYTSPSLVLQTRLATCPHCFLTPGGRVASVQRPLYTSIVHSDDRVPPNVRPLLFDTLDRDLWEAVVHTATLSDADLTAQVKRLASTLPASGFAGALNQQRRSHEDQLHQSDSTKHAKAVSASTKAILTLARMLSDGSELMKLADDGGKDTLVEPGSPLGGTAEANQSLLASNSDKGQTPAFPPVRPMIAKRAWLLRHRFATMLDLAVWQSVISDIDQALLQIKSSGSTHQLKMSKKVHTAVNELSALNAELRRLHSTLDEMDDERRGQVTKAAALESKLLDSEKRYHTLKHQIGKNDKALATKREAVEFMKTKLAAMAGQHAELNKVVAIAASHLRHYATDAVTEVLQQIPTRATLTRIDPDDPNASTNHQRRKKPKTKLQSTAKVLMMGRKVQNLLGGLKAAAAAVGRGRGAGLSALRGAASNTTRTSARGTGVHGTADFRTPVGRQLTTKALLDEEELRERFLGKICDNCKLYQGSTLYCPRTGLPHPTVASSFFQQSLSKPVVHDEADVCVTSEWLEEMHTRRRSDRTMLARYELSKRSKRAEAQMDEPQSPMLRMAQAKAGTVDSGVIVAKLFPSRLPPLPASQVSKEVTSDRAAVSATLRGDPAVIEHAEHRFDLQEASKAISITVNGVYDDSADDASSGEDDDPVKSKARDKKLRDQRAGKPGFDDDPASLSQNNAVMSWREQRRKRKQQGAADEAAAEDDAAEAALALEATMAASGGRGAGYLPPSQYLALVIRTIMQQPTQEELGQLNAARPYADPQVLKVEYQVRRLLGDAKDLPRPGAAPQSLGDALVQERMLRNEITVMSEMLKYAHVAPREMLHKSAELEKGNTAIEMKLKAVQERNAYLKGELTTLYGMAESALIPDRSVYGASGADSSVRSPTVPPRRDASRVDGDSASFDQQPKQTSAATSDPTTPTAAGGGHKTPSATPGSQQLVTTTPTSLQLRHGDDQTPPASSSATPPTDGAASTKMTEVFALQNLDVAAATSRPTRSVQQRDHMRALLSANATPAVSRPGSADPAHADGSGSHLGAGGRTPAQGGLSRPVSQSRASRSPGGRNLRGRSPATQSLAPIDVGGGGTLTGFLDPGSTLMVGHSGPAGGGDASARTSRAPSRQGDETRRPSYIDYEADYDDLAVQAEEIERELIEARNTMRQEYGMNHHRKLQSSVVYHSPKHGASMRNMMKHANRKTSVSDESSQQQQRQGDGDDATTPRSARGMPSAQGSFRLSHGRTPGALSVNGDSPSTASLGAGSPRTPASAQTSTLRRVEDHEAMIAELDRALKVREGFVQIESRRLPIMSRVIQQHTQLVETRRKEVESLQAAEERRLRELYGPLRPRTEAEQRQFQQRKKAAEAALDDATKRLDEVQEELEAAREKLNTCSAEIQQMSAMRQDALAARADGSVQVAKAMRDAEGESSPGRTRKGAPKKGGTRKPGARKKRASVVKIDDNPADSGDLADIGDEVMSEVDEGSGSDADDDLQRRASTASVAAAGGDSAASPDAIDSLAGTVTLSSDVAADRTPLAPGQQATTTSSPASPALIVAAPTALFDGMPTAASEGTVSPSAPSSPATVLLPPDVSPQPRAAPGDRQSPTPVGAAALSTESLPPPNASTETAAALPSPAAQPRPADESAHRGDDDRPTAAEGAGQEHTTATSTTKPTTKRVQIAPVIASVTPQPGAAGDGARPAAAVASPTGGAAKKPAAKGSSTRSSPKKSLKAVATASIAVQRGVKARLMNAKPSTTKKKKDGSGGGGDSTEDDDPELAALKRKSKATAVTSGSDTDGGAAGSPKTRVAKARSFTSAAARQQQQQQHSDSAATTGGEESDAVARRAARMARIREVVAQNHAGDAPAGDAAADGGATSATTGGEESDVDASKLLKKLSRTKSKRKRIKEDPRVTAARQKAEEEARIAEEERKRKKAEELRKLGLYTPSEGSTRSRATTAQTVPATTPGAPGGTGSLLGPLGGDADDADGADVVPVTETTGIPSPSARPVRSPRPPSSVVGAGSSSHHEQDAAAGSRPGTTRSTTTLAAAAAAVDAASMPPGSADAAAAEGRPGHDLSPHAVSATPPPAHHRDGDAPATAVDAGGGVADVVPEQDGQSSQDANAVATAVSPHAAQSDAAAADDPADGPADADDSSAAAAARGTPAASTNSNAASSAAAASSGSGMPNRDAEIADPNADNLVVVASEDVLRFDDEDSDDDDDNDGGGAAGSKPSTAPNGSSALPSGGIRIRAMSSTLHREESNVRNAEAAARVDTRRVRRSAADAESDARRHQELLAESEARFLARQRRQGRFALGGVRNLPAEDADDGGNGESDGFDSAASPAAARGQMPKEKSAGPIVFPSAEDADAESLVLGKDSVARRAGPGSPHLKFHPQHPGVPLDAMDPDSPRAQGRHPGGKFVRGTSAHRQRAALTTPPSEGQAEEETMAQQPPQWDISRATSRRASVATVASTAAETDIVPPSVDDGAMPAIQSLRPMSPRAAAETATIARRHLYRRAGVEAPSAPPRTPAAAAAPQQSPTSADPPMDGDGSAPKPPAGQQPPMVAAVDLRVAGAAPGSTVPPTGGPSDGAAPPALTVVTESPASARPTPHIPKPSVAATRFGGMSTKAATGRRSRAAGSTAGSPLDAVGSSSARDGLRLTGVTAAASPTTMATISVGSPSGGGGVQRPSNAVGGRSPQLPRSHWEAFVRLDPDAQLEAERAAKEAARRREAEQAAARAQLERLSAEAAAAAAAAHSDEKPLPASREQARDTDSRRPSRVDTSAIASRPGTQERSLVPTPPSVDTPTRPVSVFVAASSGTPPNVTANPEDLPQVRSSGPVEGTAAVVIVGGGETGDPSDSHDALDALLDRPDSS